MDSSIYRHLMGQIKNSCKIPHYTFPCHNLLSVETLNEVSGDLNNLDEFNANNEFLCNFPCYNSFDYNVKFSAPLCCGSGMTDVALNLVNEKMRWEKKLKNIKVPNAQKAYEDLKNFKKGNLTKISGNLTNLVRHFQNDPVPDFSGTYNWLYTGGNLVSPTLNNSVFLLSADYQLAGCNVFKLNNDMNKIAYKATYNLKSTSPVFQMAASVNQDLIFALIRQKQHLNLLKISDFDISIDISKLWGKKVKGTKFLTNCCLSEDCRIVILADSSDALHVYNVNDKKKIYGYSGKKKLKDKWTQIYLKDNTIYFVDRNSFSMLDFRNFHNSPSVLYDPVADINNCEDICSATFCENNSNYIYLGTTHCIIQVDIRKRKSIQKWTHLMKSPPQFMSCIKDCDKELLILQSPQISETVGITNECVEGENKFNYLSQSLPCALNGVKKSLKLARLNGLCLDPFIAERFNYTVTGIQLVQNDSGKIHLFTSNSGGDIFFSEIKKKESKTCKSDISNSKILESMKMYENHLEKIVSEKSEKKRRNEIDLSYLLEDFKCLNASETKRKKLNFCWEYDEMFAENSLKMYKDVLAQKILEVWNVHPKNDDEDENDEEDTVMSSTIKVQEWMKNF